MNDIGDSQQTTDPGARYNYFKQGVPIIFLFIILIFSAWVRFDGITEQGISAGDAFRYVREAKLWADNQPPNFGGGFYRPVSYFLQGMATKIFGYTDYSIKVLHGFMDMINILLIFLIAAKIAKNLWVGAISSLLYAFLPVVIHYARDEMVHVESTTFTLLAIFFFILYDNNKKDGYKAYFLLFISGLNCGLAANTHADLAFLAPGFVLYMFIKSYNTQNKKESLKRFLFLALIFSFSFFTPFLAGLLIFGPKKVFYLMLKDYSAVNWHMENVSRSISPPLLFFEILTGSIKYYFEEQFLFICILLVGAVLIIIYRKVKKENDPLLMYFPLILIFSYTFLFSCFLKSYGEVYGRYFMPLIPAVILTVTLWYERITRQFFGRFSLIGLICLFLVLFLINPKEMPGKRNLKSRYRQVYDTLKNDVNSENKLLLAPVTLYSLDRGYQVDLYFGKDAVYMCRLPMDKEYDLNSLTEVLAKMNIRFVLLGKNIDRRLLNLASPLWKFYTHWFNTTGSPYSLKKDLEIIQAYIRSSGGLLINQNRFGKIYYLTGDKQEAGLITNGSFEYWWKGVPMGKWRAVKGRISKSGEATEASASICFEPDDNKGSHIVWNFGDLFKDELKLRVCLDVKAGKPEKFAFFFTAGIDGKRQRVKPEMVRYIAKGGWTTMVNDFTITPDMKIPVFHLWLLPGAREPAFVDNVSIRIKD